MFVTENLQKKNYSYNICSNCWLIGDIVAPVSQFLSQFDGAVLRTMRQLCVDTSPVWAVTGAVWNSEAQSTEFESAKLVT
jgi:hypothetical protein